MRKGCTDTLVGFPTCRTRSRRLFLPDGHPRAIRAWRQAPRLVRRWRGVRRVGHGPVRAQGRPVRPQVEVCKIITPLTPPQNDRYEELQGTVLITGGAGGLGRLLTDYLLHYYPNCSVAIASRSAKETDDPSKKCYACDVCDEDDVRRVCDSIDDLVGVIHCAGVTYGGPFTQPTKMTPNYSILSIGARATSTKRRRTVL